MLLDVLWGTLSAMLFVHPKQLADTSLAGEVEAGIRRLRYGAIAINQWSAIAYALCAPPWGGHPSSTLADIQSIAIEVGVAPDVMTTWLGRQTAGVVPVDAAIVANQQKVADLFYKEKLIPRPVTIAGQTWTWPR